jgi:energy-coupling factor transporter ATP-binding protein EcfA2
VTSNPFSTRFIRPGAIPFIFSAGESAESLVQRLREQNWWGQIIGQHGSGKSTLLATLVPALQAAGRSVVSVALHQGEHQLPPFDRSSFASATQLLIDGYEQLSWWSRRRVKSHCRRHGAGLLVTTHEDANLPTLYRMNPSEELAQAVVSRLVPSGDARLAQADVSAAFAATGGNVRETLFRLYDVYQRAGK